jgi:hypothetical protein
MRRNKIYLTVFFTAATVYVSAMGYQLYVSALYPSREDRTQEELLLISEQWLIKYPNPNIIKFGVAVGKPFLTCRYWAFDFFKDNCYAISVIVNDIPDKNWIDDLKSVLADPCKFTDDLSAQREKYNYGGKMNCENPKCTYRMGLNFRTVTEIKNPDGSSLYEYTDVHSLIFEGKRPCLAQVQPS